MSRPLLALALLCANLAGCDGAPESKASASNAAPLLVGAASLTVTDGPVAQAMLRANDLTADGAGGVYFVDDALVRRLDAQGNVTTLAGRDDLPWTPDAVHKDGKGRDAVFYRLTKIDRDAAGNLYVVDDTKIRKVGADGTVTTLATAATAPLDLAVAPDGQVYVAEGDAVRAVASGGKLRTVARAEGRSAPLALAAAPDGTLRTTAFDAFGTDSGQIRRLLATGAGTQLARGVPAVGSLTLDPAGNLLVVSDGAIKRVAPDGRVTTLDRPAAGDDDGRYKEVAVGPGGTRYAATHAGRILRISADGKQVTALGVAGPTRDGAADQAFFFKIGDLDWVDADTLGVIDGGYRTVAADGRVATVLTRADLYGPAETVWTKGHLGVDPRGQVAILAAGLLSRLMADRKLAAVAGARDQQIPRDGKGPAAGLGDDDMAALADGTWRLVPATDAQRVRAVSADGSVTTLPALPAAPWPATGEPTVVNVAFAPDGTRYAAINDDARQVVVAYPAAGPRVIATDDAALAQERQAAHVPLGVRSNLVADDQGRVSFVSQADQDDPIGLVLVTLAGGAQKRTPIPQGLDVSEGARFTLALSGTKAAIASENQIVILPR